MSMENNVYKYLFTTKVGSTVSIQATSMEKAMTYLRDALGNDGYEKVEIVEVYSPNR